MSPSIPLGCTSEPSSARVDSPFRWTNFSSDSEPSLYTAAYHAPALSNGAKALKSIHQLRPVVERRSACYQGPDQASSCFFLARLLGGGGNDRPRKEQAAP